MAYHEVPTDAFLRVVQDGDQHGWGRECREIWAREPKHMKELTESIRREGIRMPVLIGSDGRCWDGHHRVAAARKLHLTKIPVEWAGGK